MPRAAMKPTRLSNASIAADSSSFASLASARNCEIESFGSPAIERKRLMTATASRGSAPAFSVGQAKGRGRLQRQRQHFGVRRGAVLPAERFDAGLQELARPSAAIAEHRAEIAEAGGLADA